MPHDSRHRGRPWGVSWRATRPEVPVHEPSRRAFLATLASATAAGCAKPADWCDEPQWTDDGDADCGATASQMKRSAIQRGVRTLRKDGIDKILAAQTTPEEILRVTQIDLDVD